MTVTKLEVLLSLQDFNMSTEESGWGKELCFLVCQPIIVANIFHVLPKKKQHGMFQNSSALIFCIHVGQFYFLSFFACPPRLTWVLVIFWNQQLFAAVIFTRVPVGSCFLLYITGKVLFLSFSSFVVWQKQILNLLNVVTI